MKLNPYNTTVVTLFSVALFASSLTACSGGGDSGEVTYNPPALEEVASHEDAPVPSFQSFDDRVASADPNLTTDQVDTLSVYVAVARSLVASGAVPKSKLTAQAVCVDVNENYGFTPTTSACQVLVDELKKVSQP